MPSQPPFFAPSYPAGAYPVPQAPSLPAPRPVVPQQPAPQVQAPPPPAMPRPIIRAQAADDPVPAPAPVRLPAPEALGIRGQAVLDLNTVHRRLDQLGATCFQVDRLSQGGCRVTCLLATGQQGR